jgi:tetratricopeptide (TPR) repeat protein
LAVTLVERVLDFGSSSAEADIKRAQELATKAIAASPRSAITHHAKGQVLRAQRQCKEAIPEYETALVLNRNSVSTLAAIGRCKIYIGPIEEAIPALEQAIRLSPRDPGIANWYFRIGEAHLLQSHIDEAILWLEKSRGDNAEPPYVHAFLAAAYGLKGETESSTTELAEDRRLGGEGSYLSLAGMRRAHVTRPRPSVPSPRQPIMPACARPACRRNDRRVLRCGRFSQQALKVEGGDLRRGRCCPRDPLAAWCNMCINV